MTDDPRLESLINELVDSQATPEEVCSNCPELLPQVRQRWEEMRRLEAKLDVLFPPASHEDRISHSRNSTVPEPPQIPGYEIEAMIGHGGMGVVYRARHLRLNRLVALKMLLAGPYVRPGESERLLREAEMVASLHHTNIVQIYDVGDLDGLPYFTMELMERGSLAHSLVGVPLPPGEATSLLVAVAGAVAAAHRCGVVHRDLKPANILLAADGTPKVTDFGLARRLEDSGDLTLTGALIGTPSYMAPEQARGDKSAIGPSVDVYSLGTILYELLTGRPPFRSETTTATLQQVLTEEPVPPARLNSRVPRDLETICLKCLRKEPTARYASASALADDLGRFQRGEPITARPITVWERGVCWIRRHSELAIAVAAGVLLLITIAIAIGWWFRQRAAAARAAEVDAEVELREAEQFARKDDYNRAADALERATRRLGNNGPLELHKRLARAESTLELVRRLDVIRLDRALLKGGVSLDAMLIKSVSERPDDGDQMRSGTPPGSRYAEAFFEAGLGAPGNDPPEVAARIRASPAREALVAALDDWSACAVNLDQQDWILQVVRLADPDPWRNRVRDPTTWDDRDALSELAAKTTVAEQKPQLLVVLGVRLRAKKGDAKAFLTKVVVAHPTDFWANVETGNTLSAIDKMEAIGYYRAALAIRPKTASLHRIIGRCYSDQNRAVDSIAYFEEAIRLDPHDPWDHQSRGGSLLAAGRKDEAAAEFRKALSINPNYAWAHQGLAAVFEREGRLNDAINECQEAVRLHPQFWEAQQSLRYLLRRADRWAELRIAWQNDLAVNQTPHSAWFGYVELCLFLGEEEEYRRARREMLAKFGDSSDPHVAERTGRACLLLPASEDELRQAVALTKRAVAAKQSTPEWAHPYFLFADGLAAYREERFDDAIKIMKGEAANVMGPSPRLITAMALHRMGQKDEALKALAVGTFAHDWSLRKDQDHNVWIAHILRREAESLILGTVAPIEKRE